MEQAAINPIEDQRKSALELYNQMCKECHHWSAFIQKAIEQYSPEQPSRIELLKALGEVTIELRQKDAYINQLEADITLMKLEADPSTDSIAFAEWIGHNRYVKDRKGIWYDNKLHPVAKSTAELRQIFKNRER